MRNDFCHLFPSASVVSSFARDINQQNVSFFNLSLLFFCFCFHVIFTFFWFSVVVSVIIIIIYFAASFGDFFFSPRRCFANLKHVFNANSIEFRRY